MGGTPPTAACRSVWLTPKTRRCGGEGWVCWGGGVRGTRVERGEEGGKAVWTGQEDWGRKKQEEGGPCSAVTANQQRRSTERRRQAALCGGSTLNAAAPSPPTHTQTEAEAEAKAADVRCKHLQKQLGEQRKALAAKEKEGSRLHKELERERAAVQAAEAAAAALGHDPAAAAALEADAEAARGEVQRWRDRVDELSAQLAGGFAGEATLGARWRLLRAGECTRRTCWAQGVGLFEADQLLLLHKCSPGCRCPWLLPVCFALRGGPPVWLL